MTMLAIRMLFLTWVAAGLAGCSYIASLFPDKQKQYQYTSEIPPLEVPPDLSISTVTGARWRNTEGTTSTTSAPQPAAPQPDTAAAEEGTGKATLAQNTEDVPLIELGLPFSDAWNDVGRALGRMKVEISDQNRNDGVYYVYYGGKNEPSEKKGMWDDIASLFTGEGESAVEYRVKLEAHKSAKGETTDVFLFDSEGQPVRQGAPLDLLKQLHQELQKLSAASNAKGGERAEGGTSSE